MLCCTNCFVDVEIKAIIESNNVKGECDFCGKKDEFVYELGKDRTLLELFEGLLDIYTTMMNLPDDFPKEHTDLIKNIFYYNWHIFNVKPDCIYRLITAICSEKYAEQPELFDLPVGILHSQSQEYLENNSIIKNYCWADFAEVIKHKNRFHMDYINFDILDNFLRCASKTYKAGKIFYRARICPTDNGFSPDEMGAPKSHLATAGRVSPEGISVLYLANSIQTTLHEIRAGVYDYITVGSFELLEDIEVINLAGIDKISPFIGINYGFDFLQYAVNIEHLKMMSREIAKPLRRHDSVLDYLPTQYISDYIKNKGYDGIEYMSTMCANGINLAIFDESVFNCVETTVYDIKSLSYSYEEVK